MDPVTLALAKRHANSLIAGVGGGLNPRGSWDASGAAPATPEDGDFWIVSVAGSTDLGGITDWKVGDWVVRAAGAWHKIDQTPEVTSADLATKYGPENKPSLSEQTGAGGGTLIDVPEGDLGLDAQGGVLSGISDAIGNLITFASPVTVEAVLFRLSAGIPVGTDIVVGVLNWTDFNGDYVQTTHTVTSEAEQVITLPATVSIPAGEVLLVGLRSASSIEAYAIDMTSQPASVSDWDAYTAIGGPPSTHNGYVFYELVPYINGPAHAASTPKGVIGPLDPADLDGYADASEGDALVKGASGLDWKAPDAWVDGTALTWLDLVEADVLPLGDDSADDGERAKTIPVVEVRRATHVVQVHQPSHGFAQPYIPVFWNGTAWEASLASDPAKARVDGIQVAPSSADWFVLQTAGEVFDDFGLLTAAAGNDLYLQDSGGIGPTPGTYTVPVLVAHQSGKWVFVPSPAPLAAGMGGALVSEWRLKEWAEAGAYEATSITRDSDGVPTTATVKWPDGSAGTLTVTTKNDAWLCADAYTVSHTDSGKTVTQPAVTRNAAGEVTTKPALTVA